jgi:hypothetical protein
MTIKTNFFLLFLFLNISCTPTAPYEIKSPCVSAGDLLENTPLAPCARRPVNLDHDFA